MYARVMRIEHNESNLGPYHQVHKFPETHFDLFKHLVLEEKKTPPLHEDTPLANKHTKHLVDDLLDCSIQNLLSVFKKNNNVDMLFGFSNLKQVKDWFNTDELLALQKFGFNLVVYETNTDNVIKFRRQTILLKLDKAKVLWKQNLESLVKPS